MLGIEFVICVWLQGPLPNTSGHFWLMVWEQDSRAVLMLNRVIEKGQVCRWSSQIKRDKTNNKYIWN